MSSQMVQIAQILSRLCGWFYFLSWSLSFYPQPLLNIRRKTTQGLTPDFPLLNIVGFSSYSLSTAVFLYSDVVRRQYAARHPRSPVPTVRFNDLAFGVHAWVICVVTYSQFWPWLWGWKKVNGVRRHASKVSLGIASGGMLGVALTAATVLIFGDKDNRRGWAWIDVMYALSYVKLLLTIFKYVPQAVANFRRKSTIGWSIAQVALDFCGGILSLLQLVIDSALQADWSGLTGNPMKLGLANISLIFDVIFIVQHYVLYGPVEEKAETVTENVHAVNGLGLETEPLLPAAHVRDS